MIQKRVKIVNKLGLHARASVKLINLAGRYQSRIVLSYHGSEADAKDILDVMGLGAGQGAEIELTVSGEDEATALAKICELIENRFDEAE